MKNIIICIVLLLFAIKLFAQNKICFSSYDGSGNRHTRAYCAKSTAALLDTASITQPITESLGEVQIAIFPNPTKGLFTVQVTNLPTDASGEIALCDLTGKQLVVQKTIQESNIIDLSMRPTGVYVLRIRAGDKVSEWKVVKE